MFQVDLSPFTSSGQMPLMLPSREKPELRFQMVIHFPMSSRCPTVELRHIFHRQLHSYEHSFLNQSIGAGAKLKCPWQEYLLVLIRIKNTGGQTNTKRISPISWCHHQHQNKLCKSQTTSPFIYEGTVHVPHHRLTSVHLPSGM